MGVSDPDAVLHCIWRLLSRYDDLYARRLYRDGNEYQFPKVRDWFKARHDYLHAEWLAQINASDKHHRQVSRLLHVTMWGTR